MNFEEFLAFLDVEHHLGLRGSDTWSVDGNETQIVVKTLIGEILAEHMHSIGSLPDVYLRFARGLEPRDVVLTFNYDSLLERALDAVGKSYRLFPQRFRAVGDLMGEVDDSRKDVVVLKLHGSIDWFDRAQYDALEVDRREHGLTSPSYHPVFSRIDELQVVPLLDGPRFTSDPLRAMHRVGRIEQFYDRRFLFLCTPWLLNPSSAKMLYSSTVRDFWYGLGDAGVLNFGLAIIGFSLPDHDEYARQVIYRIVKNYQTAYWETGVLDRRKTALVLVDCRTSEGGRADLKNRYAFVDWAKTQTWMKGFDEGALDLLFPNGA